MLCLENSTQICSKKRWTFVGLWGLGESLRRVMTDCLNGDLDAWIQQVAGEFIIDGATGFLPAVFVKKTETNVRFLPH